MKTGRFEIYVAEEHSGQYLREYEDRQEYAEETALRYLEKGFVFVQVRDTEWMSSIQFEACKIDGIVYKTGDRIKSLEENYNFDRRKMPKGKGGEVYRIKHIKRVDAPHFKEFLIEIKLDIKPGRHSKSVMFLFHPQNIEKEG